MVVHGEKNHRKGVPAEMAAPAEITSQRTQTSRHPGQPIAMSEKSSNFALAFKSIARSSHVHRTFIALPSHTRTRITAMRRSSSAKAHSKYKQDSQD